MEKNFQNTLKAFNFHSETEHQTGLRSEQQLTVFPRKYSLREKQAQTGADLQGLWGRPAFGWGRVPGPGTGRQGSPRPLNTRTRELQTSKLNRRTGANPHCVRPACGPSRQEGTVTAQTGQTLVHTHLGGTRSQEQSKREIKTF